MALRWRPQYEDSFHGFDDDNGGMLAAHVVPYQTDGRRWWAVFLPQDRLPGEFDTPDEAKAAAERHHAAGSRDATYHERQ